MMKIVLDRLAKYDKPELQQELSLDQCAIKKFDPELKKTLQAYHNVTSLSLNFCKLTSLSDFPLLPRLATLELNDNKIGSQLHNLVCLVTLERLELSNCGIVSLDQIRPLKQLPAFTRLQLENNPIQKIPKYREAVFEEIPQLEYLDGFDRKNQPEKLDSDSDSDQQEEDSDDDLIDSDDDQDSEEGSDEADENEPAQVEQDSQQGPQKVPPSSGIKFQHKK